MPNIDQQPEITEAQLEASGTFGVGYTEGGKKKTGQLVWTTLKARLKTFLKPTVLTATNLGTTAADISTHEFDDDDVVQICLYETAGSERASLSITVVFSDLDATAPTTSSEEWGGQGARLQLRKSGQKIQGQTAGPVNSSNKLVATIIGSASS